MLEKPKIQCPECETILILNFAGQYYCKGCDKIYSESEIRERCGI